MGRQSKRKPYRPIRSASITQARTVKMSFVDDYFRNPVEYARALRHLHPTLYQQHRRPAIGIQGLPESPQIPSFEIKMSTCTNEPSGKKSMQAVFDRLFPATKPLDQVYQLPLRSPVPKPLPAAGCSSGNLPSGDPPPVIDLHIIDLKPTVSTCNIRWAKGKG
ncbi:hypothetical protein LPJ75_001358 [Coemansia sp. RSA 2598]|nr:hypothetical protein LPJ75_001358 [Coemansia sp. RSA 2598]